MALSSLKGKQPELIRHSDRGSQYCCRDYVSQLNRRSIQISMMENGDPRENAIAERISGILKTEWIYDSQPDSWQYTVAFVSRIIDLYNNRRPHQSIGYMTPAFVHQTGLKTERKWKNCYRSESNPDEEPGRPIKEEAKVLQHGHSASAPPSLHGHAASRETNRKQKCEQKE